MALRIAFTGDISFSEKFKDGWQRADLLDAGITDFLESAHVVVGNVESPLTQEGKQTQNYLSHASAPEAGEYLERHNIRVWSLANNHIMDCGQQGFKDTLENAKANGCRVIGAGTDVDAASEPAVVEDGNVRVALFSIANNWSDVAVRNDRPGALTWNDIDVLKRRIEEIRDTVNWVVLVAHGGDEYSKVPFPYIRDQYLRFLDLGVDIVVAHHPHVVENYERVDGKAIFYSLGNFIFDTDNQRRFRNTDTGILLGIDFSEDRYSLNHLATRIDREAGTVCRTDTPDIFCNIPAKDYPQVWSVAARHYRQIDKKRRTSFNPTLAKMPGFLYAVYEVYTCRRPRDRQLQLGRLKARFNSVDEKSLGKLGEYLAGSE